jgi:hypothetical protein
MATTTPNFGWTVPTSTDLVKDGATAIETLGDGIDASFVDLKGGTTGQMLTKASNTDLDLVWVTPEIGDITSVTATSPLTGGGTTGAVTVGIQAGSTTQRGALQLTDSTSSTSTTTAATPNSVKTSYDLANAAIAKSTVTTAGDIIYRNATVPTRLGLGTAGQVLTVNSGATAPEWATASSGGMTSIASGSLSGNSLSLSSISAGYKNLVLVMRDWYWSGVSGVFLRFNGDTASNYQASGYTITTNTTSLYGGTSTRIEPIAGDAVASDNNNAMMITIYDYANTSSKKLWSAQTSYYANGNVNFSSYLTGGWLATPAAVNALTVAVANGSYSYSGGTYILYGVN